MWHCFCFFTSLLEAPQQTPHPTLPVSVSEDEALSCLQESGRSFGIYSVGRAEEAISTAEPRDVDTRLCVSDRGGSRQEAKFRKEYQRISLPGSLNQRAGELHLV